MKVAFEIRGSVDEPYLKVRREHVLAMTLRRGSMEMGLRRSAMRRITFDAGVMGLEPTQLPARLGFEASGIVTAIGASIDPHWLSKSVSTVPAFSMNQYDVLGDEMMVPVHALAEYPAGLTPLEACDPPGKLLQQAKPVLRAVGPVHANRPSTHCAPTVE